jgi:hypothetical protein
MEVVGVVFIATNHFLAIAPILPTADGPRPWSGRSAPAHQWLKTQRSAVTTISTTILHLMRCHMSDKGSRGRSGRAPRTVREDAIIHFTEPVTFGFFGFSPTGRSMPEAGRSAPKAGRSAWSQTVLAFPPSYNQQHRLIQKHLEG